MESIKKILPKKSLTARKGKLHVHASMRVKPKQKTTPYAASACLTRFYFYFIKFTLIN